MEELQDAIEDAQYINAMQDDTPKPTKEWKRPTPEELQRYVSKLQSTNPKSLEPDGICAGSLGLYMVRRQRIVYSKEVDHFSSFFFFSS